MYQRVLPLQGVNVAGYVLLQRATLRTAPCGALSSQ